MKPVPDPIQRFLQSSVVHVLFAFIVMGSWAVFANRGHPSPFPYIAGLVQGALSASITYMLKRSIEALAVKFSGSAALWAPPLITCSVSLGILVAIHTLAGTPEILRTISVPFFVASTYATIYNYTVWKGQGSNNDQ